MLCSRAAEPHNIMPAALEMAGFSAVRTAVAFLLCLGISLYV